MKLDLVKTVGISEVGFQSASGSKHHRFKHLPVSVKEIHASGIEAPVSQNTSPNWNLVADHVVLKALLTNSDTLSRWCIRPLEWSLHPGMVDWFITSARWLWQS